MARSHHRVFPDAAHHGRATPGGLGIWTMVDFVMIAVGNFEDSDGNAIKSES